MINTTHLTDILDKWKINVSVATLLEKWNEPHRHYHNQEHLDSLLQQIERDRDKMTAQEYEQLVLTALFHDIVYDVLRNDNEEQSAAYFLSVCGEKDAQPVREIYDAIIATKTHEPVNGIAAVFNRYDMSIVEGSLDELLRWEEGIYQEYKVFGKDVYQKGRLQFLSSLPEKYPANAVNLVLLIEVVKKKY